MNRRTVKVILRWTARSGWVAGRGVRVGCAEGVRAALEFTMEGLTRGQLRLCRRATPYSSQRTLIVTERGIVLYSSQEKRLKEHFPSREFLTYLAERGVEPGWHGYLRVEF